MLMGERMCTLVIGSFEVGVVVLKFSTKNKCGIPKHYFILVISSAICKEQSCF
jgi:hypothetical protein